MREQGFFKVVLRQRTCRVPQFLMSSATISSSTTPWIVGRRQDLGFFLCSSLIGYVLVAVAMFWGELPAILFLQISFAIDGPHVYSTATRVLLDPSERKRTGPLFWLLVPLCLICPGLLLLGLSFPTVFLMVMVWGQYHIAKQHVGFVLIYRRKAMERSNFKLDRRFTLISLMLPFASYLCAALTGRALFPLFLGIGVVLAIHYSYRQRGQGLVNSPKLMLLAFTIPLHWLVWGFAAARPSPQRLGAAAAITVVGHGLQYLRLMWLHNSNRFSERTGILGFVSRTPVYFVGAAVILSFPQYLGEIARSQVVGSAALGLLMFHYLMDSRIWRIRGDAELARALNLA